MTRVAYVKSSGMADAAIMPGDSIDLGPDGVIVYLADEDAEAWRLQQAKRVREINATIDHVKRTLGAPE